MSIISEMKSNVFWTLASIGAGLGIGGCGGEKPGVDPEPRTEVSTVHAMVYSTAKNTTLTFDGVWNDQRTDIIETFYRMNVQVAGPYGDLVKTGDNNGNVLSPDEAELDIMEDNVISKGHNLYVKDTSKPWAIARKPGKLIDTEETIVTNDNGQKVKNVKNIQDVYLMMGDEIGLPIAENLGDPAGVAINADNNYKTKFPSRKYGMKTNLPKGAVQTLPLMEYKP